MSPPPPPLPALAPARPLAPLPPSLASRLRGHYAISSVVQGISELIDNALDGGAGQVVVSVDLPHWSFSVEDDGCGIPAGDFPLLGRRFYTSKLRSVAELDAGVLTRGYRGVALSSFAGELTGK